MKALQLSESYALINYSAFYRSNNL